MALLDLRAALPEDNDLPSASLAASMTTTDTHPTRPLRNEALLFAGCLLCGLFLLPLAIYAVGFAIFNEFGGGGLGAFYRAVQADLWRLDPVVWFLALSPYLVIQTLRITFHLYRGMRTV